MDSGVGALLDAAAAIGGFDARGRKGAFLFAARVLCDCLERFTPMLADPASAERFFGRVGAVARFGKANAEPFDRGESAELALAGKMLERLIARSSGAWGGESGGAWDGESGDGASGDGASGESGAAAAAYAVLRVLQGWTR
eukprot:3629966-Rhodomonas_salina.1